MHAAFAGAEVDAHHRGASIRRPADERDGRSIDHQRIDARPRQRDRGHGAAVRVEPAQPPCAAAAPRADHAPGRVEPEGRRAELPQRLPELAVGPIHAPERAVAPAVEVPPSIGVRDAPQGAVGRTRRLERRASRPSPDSPRRTGHAVPVEVGEIQGRGIPGHVRLIPGEPCEPPSVAARGRGRVEVMARGEHPNGAAGDGDRDQVVGRRRTVTMSFAHREQAPVRRIEDQIAEPGRAFRRQRNGRGAGRLDMDPAVRVVREPDPVPGDGIRAAAVFMDARPHVERRGGGVGGPSRVMGLSCHIGPKAGSNEDVASAFPRPSFEPADPARVQADRREPDGVGDDGVGGDRGRPGPVRKRPHAGSPRIACIIVELLVSSSSRPRPNERVTRHPRAVRLVVTPAHPGASRFRLPDERRGGYKIHRRTRERREGSGSPEAGGRLRGSMCSRKRRWVAEAGVGSGGGGG